MNALSSKIEKIALFLPQQSLTFWSTLPFCPIKWHSRNNSQFRPDNCQLDGARTNLTVFESPGKRGRIDLKRIESNSVYKQ